MHVLSRDPRFCCKFEPLGVDMLFVQLVDRNLDSVVANIKQGWDDINSLISSKGKNPKTLKDRKAGVNLSCATYPLIPDCLPGEHRGHPPCQSLEKYLEEEDTNVFTMATAIWRLEIVMGAAVDVGFLDSVGMGGTQGSQGHMVPFQWQRWELKGESFLSPPWGHMALIQPVRFSNPELWIFYQVFLLQIFSPSLWLSILFFFFNEDFIIYSFIW